VEAAQQIMLPRIRLEERVVQGWWLFMNTSKIRENESSIFYAQSLSLPDTITKKGFFSLTEEAF
jgi:hypothetical protein